MDWESFERFLTYGVAGIATLIATIFARRQSKEDTNLKAISEAVVKWKEIAENNAHHAAECDAKVDKLEIEVSTLTDLYYEERSKRAKLELRQLHLEAEIERLKNEK